MTALTEPAVLAATKSHLFPDDAGGSTAYAVTDTQFATEEWVADNPIPRDIKTTLAPFNHVRVGTGYPDLVAAGRPVTGLASPQHSVGDTPLIVVEAKGETATGSGDIGKALVQAQDRLRDANAAYVSAPHETITAQHQQLARQLGIGLLGITTGQDVEVCESATPVGTGNQLGITGDLLQLRASYSAIGRKKFAFNNPKNYLAFPLCVYADGNTETLYREHVVDGVRDGRRGAAALGLVTANSPAELTMTGREVVRFALREYGTLDNALETVDSWFRMHGRFIDNAPAWSDIARTIVMQHPMMQRIVQAVEQAQATQTKPPTIVDVFTTMYEQYPADALEIFIRADTDARETILDGVDTIDMGQVTDPAVYSGQLIHQIKHLLHHVGVLTSGGNRRGNFDPTNDEWALCTYLDIN